MANSREFPFGWEQDDPVVVCINDQHMTYVQRAFKLRAHYILPLSAIIGRRYNRAIVFRKAVMSDTEEEQFRRWLQECIYTHVDPKGEGVILV